MLGLKARDVPGRVATGAFILHSGLGKWKGDEARAKALHSMAANAFPVLKDIPPAQFSKLLAGSEIALGAALLGPCTRARQRCASRAASGQASKASR